jgi:RimJ/RimL family protein N-acetyltransferase
VLRTERLLLRPIQAEDAEPLHSLFADWEVVRWLSTPPWPYTIEDAKSFIHQRLNLDVARALFAIIRDNVLIGGIEARVNAAAGTQRRRGPVLGYWLGRPYWGHGYMTEAARGYLSQVFAAGLGDTVYSGAFTDNAVSLRVQEKLGFVRDGQSMLFSKPRGAEFPHINTVLTREGFSALAR